MKNGGNKGVGIILLIFFSFLFSCDFSPKERDKLREVYASYFFFWGFFHNYNGHYDQAISDFNKSIEINPSYAGAYNNRGLAYCNKGQYDQAISDYNKALEINPAYADAYYNRANAYYSRGDYAKSWDDVKRAQNLGYQVSPEFLNKLRKASGKQA